MRRVSLFTRLIITMHQGKYVFAQVMEHMKHYDFDRCVSRFDGERYAKSFSCREQFLAMAFGQFAYRESLRDVTTCLSAQGAKLYHLGFRSPLVRTTLAHANEQRDWRIYRDLAQILIAEAQKLYADEPNVASDIDSACYAIDSTSIELCLALFPWSPYMKTKSALKLHTVMDIRGSIPTFFDMTSGKVADVYFLDLIVFIAGAFYIMDRGYIDFARLHSIHKVGAFFVTRAMKNTRYERRYSHPVDKKAGILCDQTIVLTGELTKTKYPDILRRVKYRDMETGRVYVFLTNNFTISAPSVALLYKHRWKIELFFKWIKQHLKIKTFWGYSENAVKTQVCIALCAYLVVAILKKRLRIKRSLYEMLQILSVSLFDKSPLVELFSLSGVQTPVKGSGNTLSLFDF